MKIICDKSELVSSVSIVSKAVAVRSTTPILECIAITADNGEIRFTANNNELGIETIVNGQIEEEGVVAIDAKIFSEIIRKLPDNLVEISVDDQYQVKIVCEKSKFNLTGKSGDDFIYLPQIPETSSIEISQYSLKESIKQTIFSVADNDSNLVMTGELFEVIDNKLKIVSLDGHRISIRNINLNDSYGNKKVIVPGKSLQELNKILTGEMDEMVVIYFGENHLMFCFDATTIVTRLIDGNYFDVSRMISSDYETKVTVNKKQFLDSIDRATLLSREGEKKPVVMSFDDERVAITMKSFIGSMHEEIDIDKEGKDIMIGFNPNYFIDALRVIDDEEITLYLINRKYPCLIKDEKESYVYLILPVNFVSEED